LNGTIIDQALFTIRSNFGLPEQTFVQIGGLKQKEKPLRTYTMKGNFLYEMASMSLIHTFQQRCAI